MKTYRNMNGFTLIEVVAVLVILGILTAVALTRLSSNQNNLIAATDTLTSQLRLAQAKAMSTSVNTTDPGVSGVRFISATQYHLFSCPQASTCDPALAANQKSFLGADSIIVDISNKNVQVTNGALVLAFNRFGTPYTDAALTTILTSPLTLTLQDNKSNSRTINITPQTGMIRQS